MNAPAPYWKTDEDLFASLLGGQAVIDWFGFCPDFHDGELEKLELSDGNATLTIRTHRMTSETDAKGFVILDRHAVVTLLMRGVTGVKLGGNADSIILDLVIRRLQADGTRSDWETCAGPVAGNIEVVFDTAIGLHGSIFTQELECELQPRSDSVGS